MRNLFRDRRILTVSLATAVLAGTSSVAFAVVQSVDSSPQPQVVIPSSANTGIEHRATRGNDDNASHVTERRHGADDAQAPRAGDDKRIGNRAAHDAGDDNGGRSRGSHRDDLTPEPVESADDHGGRFAAGRGGGDDAPASRTSSDDHGGHGSDG